MSKSEERKYRFQICGDGAYEYHVFESRYYAQKYLDEVVLRNEYHQAGVFEFEIRDEKFGFVIYEKKVTML